MLKHAYRHDNTKVKMTKTINVRFFFRETYAKAFLITGDSLLSNF